MRSTASMDSPTSTKVIGLDLSLNGTAWCTSRESTEVLVFRNRKADPKGDSRLVFIRSALDMVLSEAWFDLAVIESLPPYGKGSASLGLVHGVVREVVASHMIKAVTVTPSSLKLHATGSGRASKDQMMAALVLAHPDLDCLEWDDNQVDAWWLRDAGLAYLEGRPHPIMKEVK